LSTLERTTLKVIEANRRPQAGASQSAITSGQARRLIA
jgi:hypothetical protein